ncbi:MAG: LysM peptidoglycan-binding domain-containing protein, partial [Anaerolineae bacterium]|nr:LysM peptidoglycan-binding domain-containing protein [Anaerolineae bacterium]
LKVVLTLNDVHLLNLERVSELDVKVADRYKDVSTVTAYDLENEPVFYNLVAAIYPDGFEAPVQTSQLVDHYGERVSREGALDLQRNRRIPAHLDPDKAYYYINALRLFLEYDQAVNRFVNQGKGTIVEFMLADEAEPWYTLISVLDGTVEAWLRARSEPIRATGCRHMLTVGWNWMHFASLPANRMLDFQQYHNYASLSLAGFNTNVAHLQGLRRAFPDHPLIFGEFGWSNQSSRNPATSQAISAELTALYETAMHAFLRANGFGGAMKWVLNDLDITHNPYEANFGVFKLGDQPKPVRDLVLRISQDWLSVDQAGSFTAVRDIEAGMSYRFDLPHQTTVGGHVYQDDEIGWQADRVAHCFITRENEALRVESSGAGQLALEPWKLLPSWNQARETELYRVFSDNQRTRQRTFAVGETVAFDLGPGAQYVISMGVEQPTEPRPPELPEVEPNPGEHVVLLADSDDDLAAALGYIRSFTPDFTFAAETVAGRWAYVTVIATPAQIAAELLDNMLGAGAILVERVVGDSPEDTKAILDEMVRRGQRFLSAVTPPQEEPPGPSPTPGEPEPPPPDQDELYVIQPGDTLGKIAQTVYGDFRLWTLIFEANRDKIADPALIRVGWELRIPARA